MNYLVICLLIGSVLSDPISQPNPYNPERILLPNPKWDPQRILLPNPHPDSEQISLPNPWNPERILLPNPRWDPERILLPNPHPYPVNYDQSNIGAIDGSQSNAIRPLNPIERLRLEMNKSNNKTSNFIVGGSVAPSGAHPWQISLQFSSRHGCGGSIINANTIVTAAHCVDGASLNSMSVRVNSLKHNEGGSVHTLSRSVPHPSYNDWTIDYDYAVCKLNQPLTLGQLNCDSIKLSPECPKAGDIVFISGWGTMSEGSGSLPDDLQEVYVPVISNEECNIPYGSINPITDQMFCTHIPGGGKDACQGDSGGPVGMKVNGENYLYGAVSWGVGCAQANYPGVLSNLCKVIDWINQIANS